MHFNGVWTGIQHLIGNYSIIWFIIRKIKQFLNNALNYNLLNRPWNVKNKIFEGIKAESPYQEFHAYAKKVHTTSVVVLRQVTEENT